MRVACLIPWLVIGMVLPGQIPSLFGQDVATLIHDVSDMADGSVTQARFEAQRQAASGGLPYRSYKKGDRSSFSGKYTPPELPDDKKGRFVYGLALFSDDGCNVTVDGSLIHERMGQGQHLPNIGDSFHVLPTALAPGEPVDITVDYSNIIYDDDPDSPGYPDIDGCTLFLYLLPVELKDIQGASDTDDRVIENMPPRAQNESENDYIQRPWPDRNIAFIEPHRGSDDSPDMPRLVARLPGSPHGLKVKWRLEVDYERGNGWRTSYIQNWRSPEDLVRIPAAGQGGDATFTADMDAHHEWRIFETQDWQNEIQQRGFFGGTGKLYLWFPSQSQTAPTEPIITFRIGGKNPDADKAKPFIGQIVGQVDNRLWFAYAIAKEESHNYGGPSHEFYNQYFSDYRKPSGNGWDTNMDWQCWAKGWPAYNLDRDSRNGPQNGPGGYGLFQVTGNATNENAVIPRRQICNWHDNVLAGIAIIHAKAQWVDARYGPLQQTYQSSSGAIPSYPQGYTGNKKRLSGWDAYTCTAYNGLDLRKTSQLIIVRMNGFKGAQRTCWEPLSSGWKFRHNSTRYCEKAVDYVEETQ